MNSGSRGCRPATLTVNEYDGTSFSTTACNPVHLAWHFLPRKAARVVPSTTTARPGASPQVIGLNNTGVGTAQNDAYALLALSPKPAGGAVGRAVADTGHPRPVGINTFPVPGGLLLGERVLHLGVRRSTRGSGSSTCCRSVTRIELTTNRDGTVELRRAQSRSSGPTTITDGRQLSWVLNAATGSLSASFFADTRPAPANTVLLICGEQIGMSAAKSAEHGGEHEVVAQDFYYGGPGDEVRGLNRHTVGERFVGVASDVPGQHQ